MRTTLSLCLAAAALAGSGCYSARPSAPASYEHLGIRNLTQEPVRWVDNQVFRDAAVDHARCAWHRTWVEMHRQAPDQPYSHDYACGFIEGYVDYLDAGGNGEPPVAAPFCYRLTKYKTAKGVQAAEAWFAGFRHGAAVAQASGLRELILVPLSGPVTAATPPPLQTVSPTTTGARQAPDTPAATPELPTLPEPTEQLPAPMEEPWKGPGMLPMPGGTP
jgi:hypothetical protein